eukprot:PhF_6_TR25145/c0_g1_i1/m.34633
MDSRPHCITSPADVTEFISSNETTLVLWDADDTLVATAPTLGPRSRLLVTQSDLDSVFSQTVPHAEHKILTAGSVEDLFFQHSASANPLLQPWGTFFRQQPSLSSSPHPHRIVPTPSNSIVFTHDLMGITVREHQTLPPSKYSVCVPNLSKLEIALYCALSNQWDHVIFVDNQMY